MQVRWEGGVVRPVPTRSFFNKRGKSLELQTQEPSLSFGLFLILGALRDCNDEGEGGVI